MGQQKDVNTITGLLLLALILNMVITTIPVVVEQIPGWQKPDSKPDSNPDDSGSETNDFISGIHLGIRNNSIVISWYSNHVRMPFVILNSTKVYAKMNCLDGFVLNWVEIENLKLNCNYSYKVGSDSNLSKIYDFTTPGNVQETKLLVWGDSRTGRSARTALALHAAENVFDFAIHTGDVVGTGSDDMMWRRYFEDVEPFSSAIPTLYAVGNHDGPFYNMRYHIAMDSPYYSYRQQDILFIVLESNFPEGVPIEWINLTLSQSNASWKIAVFHTPAFEMLPNRDDNHYIIEHWGPIFDKHGLDLLLTGHSHIYGRTFPKRFDGDYNSSERFDYDYNSINGTIHITTGGGGAPLYGQGVETLPEWTAAFESKYHFVKMVINNTTLKSLTWGMVGSEMTLIDNFTISR